MNDCREAHKRMKAAIAKFNKSCENANHLGELNEERVANIREMLQIFKEDKDVNEPHQ
jgi:hypothetical protein